MKLSLSLAACVCSYVGMTHALAIEHVNTALAGPMIFKGPITPNGPNFTLSSTAESIYHEILGLNPNFKADDSDTTVNARGTAALFKRQQSGGCCRCLYGPYTGEADSNAIGAGSSYLYNLGGPSGQICSTDSSGVAKVYCSNNAAIYLVNMRQAQIGAPCRTLGNYAAQLVQSCNKGGTTNGQICDAGGYCVIAAASTTPC